VKQFSPALLLRFPTSQWQHNQFAVTVSAALIFAGFTLVMPFLPLYIQMLGITSQSQVAIWAGIVLGVSPLLASFIGPFWGRLADRYGLKVMAIRISLALFLIWFLTGFAQNVYHLFVLRILLGIFGGFNTFSISLVTQLCPQDKVGKVIGTLQAVQIFSAAVGPFFGGILASWIGIRHTFLITSLMCLLSLLLFIFFYKDKTSSPAQTPSLPAGEHEQKGFKRLMRLPNFAFLAVLLFVVTAIDRSFGPVIPLFVVGLIPNPQEAARRAGVIISLAAFGESFSAWYSGRRIFKGGAKRFLLQRLAFGGMVSVALGFADTVSQLLWLRLLLALLAGGTLTIAYTLASQVIPENERAAAFGLLSSFAMLGGAAGPMCGGLLTSLSIPLVFATDAAAFGLLFGLAYRCIKNDHFADAGSVPG
jgi:DHA1 family multidrug resistance protein-like MFS transporter